jgi:ankyrin repeat protein
LKHFLLPTNRWFPRRKGKYEILEIETKQVDVNAKNKYCETALMNAAFWGHKENVALLIDEGADINAKTKSGETALEFAAFSYHKDVVELLKFHGAKE